MNSLPFEVAVVGLMPRVVDGALGVSIVEHLD
jgi:hypothetical protein